MHRRSLFRKLGAAAAAVAIAPAVSVQAEPDLTDREKAERLMERMQAEPDTYPELWAEVRKRMGQESPPMMQGAMHGLPTARDAACITSGLRARGNLHVRPWRSGHGYAWNPPLPASTGRDGEFLRLLDGRYQWVDTDTMGRADA